MWILVAQFIIELYEPNCHDNRRTNNTQANAIANMVRTERLGFRQIFRQAIFKSIDMVPYLIGLFREDRLKRSSERG